MADLVIRLPQLCGTRWAAEQVAAKSSLEAVRGRTVVVDMVDVASAAQGFCDELVKQLVDVAGAAQVTIRNDYHRAAQFMLDAAERRGLSGRVIVETATTEDDAAAEPMRIWWNKNLRGKISPGKLAAHAAHAALTAYGIRYDHPIVVLGAGRAKIEQMEVRIRDAGLTELPPGTLTTGVERVWRSGDGEPADGVLAALDALVAAEARAAGCTPACPSGEHEHELSLAARAAAAIREAHAAGYAQAIADTKWLAEARAQYSSFRETGNVADYFALSEPERAIHNQVVTARQVADLLSGDDDGMGWLPSWLWEDWEARRGDR